jgi:acyl-CoA thioester hydrolase
VSDGAGGGWPYTHTDRVRFGDLDAMGHLNNVAFLGFFESARIAYLRELLPAHDPTDPVDFGLIFAECKINYRSPGRYDELVRTRVRPASVARSSFQIEFEMRAGPDARLLAEGYGVLVGYDYRNERPQPLPDALKALLRDAGAADAEPEPAR